MTVIIRELVVKTAVIEPGQRAIGKNENQLKKSIVKNCMQQLKRRSNSLKER